MKFKNLSIIGIIPIVLLSMSLIPSIILFRLQSEDAYWYMVFPFVKKYQSIGYLDIHSYVAGQNSFLIILSDITGIIIDKLQFLPVSGLIIPILGFILIRKISNSDIIAAMFSFYYGFNLTNAPRQYSVSSIELSVLLFFTFLIFLYIFFIKSRNTSIIILLLTIFTTVHFVYYSVEFWTTGLMIALNFILIIGYYFKLHELSALQKGMSNLTLVFIIIFLSFNEIFYQGFVKRLVSFETPSYTIEWIYLKLLPLFGTARPIYGYEYVQINPTNDYLVILQMAILSILLFVLTLKGIQQILLGSQSEKINFYFALSLIGVMVLEIVVYFLRGTLSLRTINYLAPISILLLINFNYGDIKISNKAFKISLIFISIISLIVLSSFIVSYNAGFNYYSQYDKVASSGEWYETHIRSGSSALTDMNTIYKFMLLSVNSPKQHPFVFYDNNYYEKLISGNATTQDFDFCVVDYGALDKMLISKTPKNDWKIYKPLSFYYSKLGNNSNLNKIYASSVIEIWSINDFGIKSTI